MKRLRFLIPVCLAALSLLGGCKAFNTASDTNRYSSQGKPYELIVVCSQPEWEGQLGDTLRSVLAAPIPYLDREEPLFSLLHVTQRGFTKLVVSHRNILKVVVNPEIAAPTVAVQYDLTASPQIVMTLQGPDLASMIGYLSQNRQNLVYVLEKAERDRAVDFAAEFPDKRIGEVIRQTFGIEMTVPKGYVLAKQEPDFMWMRYEYPTASQGFMLYSYPYKGPVSLSAEALEAARLKYAARIPGPSDGSHMTTSSVYPPQYRMIRIEGRLWAELRGFWDVEGDFMGGPFVSYSTVDTATNRVITLDCYVFSPKLGKRNFMRGVEHLVYMIRFPRPEAEEVTVTLSFPDRDAWRQARPEIERILQKYDGHLM